MSNQSITPEFRPGQFVRHVVDDSSKGIVTGFMIQGKNHSYQVQWGVDKSFWHLDYELVAHKEPTRQIGFWSDRV